MKMGTRILFSGSRSASPVERNERITASYLSSKVRSDELDSFMFKVLAEEEPIQFIYDVAHQFPGISDFHVPD